MTGKKLIKIAADEDDDKFPSLLDDIREHFGDEVADKLQEAVGGNRISICSAASMKEDSLFARAVGFETALAIAEMFFPGEKGYRTEVTIPLGQKQSIITLRNRVSAMLSEGGYSARFIASMCGVHERTVYRERRRMKEAGEVLGPYSSWLDNKLLAPPDEATRMIEILLLEGFEQSLLRQYLRLSGGVITKIRNRLIKEGKLEC